MTRASTEERDLLSSDDIRRWQAERDRIVAQIKSLEHKRDALEKIIKAGAVLVSAEKKTVTVTPKQIEPEIKAPLVEQAQSPASLISVKRRLKKDTWTSTIERVLHSALRGLDYPELKAEIRKTHLSSRLEQTDKALYTAVAKLEKTHRVVKHKGLIYSPSAFNKFQLDVKAGRVSDEAVPAPNHRSAMTEAVKAFLHKHADGAKSAEIIAELKKNSEFAKTIDRNKTHIYNIFARLIERNEVSRVEGVYRIALPISNPTVSANRASPENQSDDAPRATGEPKLSLIENHAGKIRFG